MKQKFSFTLVEILVVTALVSLLAVIGFGVYGYAMNASRRAATEAVIQQITAGLENFKLKTGYYPASSTAYTEIKVTTTSDLITSITFGANPEWKKTDTNGFFAAFFKPLDQEKFKKNISGGKIVDSWGGTIYYRYPGVVNTTGYDLVAPGEDGKFGTGKADAPPAALSNYKENGEWACDDITNFMDK